MRRAMSALSGFFVCDPRPALPSLLKAWRRRIWRAKASRQGPEARRFEGALVLKPIKPVGHRFPIRLGRLFFFAGWALPASGPADFASRRAHASSPFFPLPCPKFLFQSPWDASSGSHQRFAFQGLAAARILGASIQNWAPKARLGGPASCAPPFLAAAGLGLRRFSSSSLAPGFGGRSNARAGLSLPFFSSPPPCAPRRRGRGSGPDDFPPKANLRRLGRARRCRFASLRRFEPAPDSGGARGERLLSRPDYGQALKRKKTKRFAAKRSAFFLPPGAGRGEMRQKSAWAAPPGRYFLRRMKNQALLAKFRQKWTIKACGLERRDRQAGAA